MCLSRGPASHVLRGLWPVGGHGLLAETTALDITGPGPRGRGPAGGDRQGRGPPPQTRVGGTEASGPRL